VIVMKFGGSSLASAAAIEWVAGIVKAQVAEHPVVVVSAMGKTTDRLIEALQYAAQGSAYSAWRRLEDLRQYHFQETQRLLGAQARDFLDRRIAPLFRDLHGKLIELEEGRKLTPDLHDEVLGIGECLSSEIVAAALDHAGIRTRHVDSREVIVTDDQFTRATPLCWETYAKLRRTVAAWAREQVVVMGGFIGATREGIATTLGRGGSDLTASLVGAGISANAIQIWTDVDGMLTCDPRVLHGGYRLRSLQYDEAEELASAGAKVLCPKTVGPAIRQGIPIIIRNSRHPELEGTHIVPEVTRKPGVVKAIACKTGMTIVHLVVPEAGILPGVTEGLYDLFERHRVKVEMVQAQPDGVSFAVQNSAQIPELLRSVDHTVRITVEEQSAIVTLVGDSITTEPCTMKRALSALLKDTAVRMVSQGGTQKSIRLAVPAEKLAISVENLHREFFRAPDPEMFASTPESSRRLFLARRPVERALPPNSGWAIHAEPLPSR
jgi:aspartate kinase